MSTTIFTVDGRDSYYQRSSRGVIFAEDPSRVVPTSNPDGLEVLDEIIARDDEAVYCREERVEGVDPTSFRWLGRSKNLHFSVGYAVDKGGVWALAHHHTYGSRLKQVARLALDRFRLLRGGYAADDRFVVFNGTRLPGAKADRFEVLDEEGGIGRDERHVYYMGKVIEGADPRSWRVAPGTCSGRNLPYSCDQRSAYFGKDSIVDSDPSSFVVLNEHYGLAADATGLYWHGHRHKAEGRIHFLTSDSEINAREALRRHDPHPERWWNKPVEEISDPPPAVQPALDHGYFFIDGHPYWRERGGGETLRTDMKIDADPASFSVLSEVYARDAASVFCLGRRLKKAEAATFKLLEGYQDSSGVHTAGCWARDRSHVFRYNAVRKMDAATFEQMGVCYARDQERVYAYGQTVRGADPTRFEVIDGPAGRCGTKCYWEGYVVSQEEMEEKLIFWKGHQ
jgi:hypothetical protein